MMYFLLLQVVYQPVQLGINNVIHNKKNHTD